MSSGIALLLGVNRIVNKQLWIADSTDLTQNAAIPVLRLMTTAIDCVATNGSTPLPISFGNTGSQTTINGSTILLSNNTTCVSSLNVSGVSTLQDATTCLSTLTAGSLNISNNIGGQFIALTNTNANNQAVIAFANNLPSSGFVGFGGTT